MFNKTAHEKIYTLSQPLWMYSVQYSVQSTSGCGVLQIVNARSNNSFHLVHKATSHKQPNFPLNAFPDYMLTWSWAGTNRQPWHCIDCKLKLSSCTAMILQQLAGLHSVCCMVGYQMLGLTAVALYTCTYLLSSSCTCFEEVPSCRDAEGMQVSTGNRRSFFISRAASCYAFAAAQHA